MSRVVLIVIGFVLWVMAGAPLPIPVVRVTPLAPSADIPVFSRVDPRREADQRLEIERARREGVITEDPAFQVMRRAVIRTARNLEASPCSEANRREFAVAAVALWQANLEADRRPVPLESATINGRQINARGYFSEESHGILIAALDDGVFRADDFPTRGELASLNRLYSNPRPRPDAGPFRGRFACSR